MPHDVVSIGNPLMDILIEVEEDFLKELVKNKKAYDFFKTLNKTNTFTVSWQLHNAKRPETRERRMRKFIQMLERREKLY